MVVLLEYCALADISSPEINALELLATDVEGSRLPDDAMAGWVLGRTFLSL